MNARVGTASGEAQNSKARAIDLFGRADWRQALAEFEVALEESPRDTELHNFRARCLDFLGQPEEALEAIENALAIDPESTADRRNRAVLLRRLGRPTEALAEYQAILARSAGDVDAWVKCAQILTELEQREEALKCAERAVHIQPLNLAALNARGLVLERFGRYRDALADFERMLELTPDYPDAINNSGMIYARQGKFSQALAAYTRSLGSQPDQPQAFYNRSLVRLALGDWRLGLEEFESRWETLPLKRVSPNLSTPQWTGAEDLHGKTIFVYHEQGYGDTLQCARYVPQLAALGARVILAVPRALIRLLQTLEGKPCLIALEDQIPPHDLHCPLMSLLRAFGATLEGVSASSKYLRAYGDKVLEWKRLLGRKRRPRIGIAWRGRPYPPINYPRDVPLAQLKPLFCLPADFVSLHIDLSDEEREVLGQIDGVDTRAAGLIRDFSDTAALIESLDLVISVDTAVAHLAGALGRPVWLLNRHASCWRWGQEGSRSAWYPTMRIFRQTAVGRWDEALNEIETETRHFVATPTSMTDQTLGPVSAPQQTRRPLRGETFRFVCATRYSEDEFLAKSPLGRSLPFYRTFPKGQRIELRLFKENSLGLPCVYNTAIEESRSDPAILVFIHDDVYLTDYYWADHLLQGLREFDIVGVAGNRRRSPRQASWMYLDDQFQRDNDENLSGVLGHGEGFPNLKELSIYGDPCQECKLLDGVLLAVRSRTLVDRELRFDARFEFDFYDLDFCRQAENRSVRMGTWALSIIHASAGKLGSPTWRRAYREYLGKYDEL